MILSGGLGPSLFYSLFRGITTAYGTYDPKTGRHWQIKEPVTKRTIYNHLMGIQPYGFYTLEDNMTRVGVVDFDNQNPEPPLLFIRRAEQVSWAFKNDYTGYGCEETIIAAHCDKSCPVRMNKKVKI
jgi:hypothetical protein